MPEEANPGGAPEPQKPEGSSAIQSGGAPAPPSAEAAKPPVPAPAKPAGGAAAKPPAPAAPKAPPVMQATPWAGELVEELKEEFGERIKEFCTYVGQNFLVAEPGAVVPIIEYLKCEQGFDYLVDITAVDYPTRPERFELVWILYSFERNERIRIKTRVRDGEKAVSSASVHLTADWLEREVYDMFGIEFEGHPNMKRILLPEGWSGFPLRKDKSIVDMDNRWVRENLGIESGQ